jgi:Domain of unknown function (DUF4440)
MRALIVALLLACTGGAAAQTGQASAAAAPDPAAQEVVEAAQRLFDAMAARDSTALHALIHPDAAFIALLPDGRVHVQSDVPAWIRAVAASPEPWHERMWAPRVEVTGALATLWAPYTFHQGDTFSHCGTDAFQFVRDGEAWRLIVVTFTIQPEGCTDADGNQL